MSTPPAHDEEPPADATRVDEIGEAAPGDYEELRAIDSSDYVIRKEIARGGMGRILEGHDRRIGRSVAIKEVLVELLKIYPEEDREELLRRFEREARITARLEHPAIVPVYEIGSLEGTPFFAMKKVDGRPLDALIDESKTLADRMRLLPTVIAISEALGYAHDRGVIHRDLKPANVLVGPHGETVVIDWGLAKQVDLGEDEESSEVPVLDSDDGLRTVAGSVFGTPLYMPPEQARGEPVDRRADVYSLGAILYHLLAGKPAYTDGSSKQQRSGILDALKAGPPMPLSEIAEDVPPDLLSIVEKSMARDKDSRYSSAALVAKDLRQFEAGKLVGVHAYSFGELLRRWLRKHRAAVVTASIAVLALAVVAGVLVQKLRSARDDAQAEAKAADESRERATRLFTELGRTAFLREELVEASFSLIHAGLLGADVTGLDMLTSEIAKAIDGVIRRVGDSHPADWRFSGDGKRLVVGFESGKIVVVDADSGENIIELIGPERLSSVSVGPDGKFLLASATKEPAQLWDLDSRTVIRSFECPGNRAISDSEVSPTGQLVVLACSLDGLRLFDRASGELLGRIAFELPNLGLRFSVDGSRLAVHAHNAALLLLDLDAGRKITDTQIGTKPTAIWSVDGPLKKMLVVDNRQVTLTDLDRGTSATLEGDYGDVDMAVLSPDGQDALFAYRDGTLALYEIEAAKEVRRWQAHPGALHSAAISADGSIIVSIGHEGVIRTWDAKTGRLRQSTLGLTGPAQPIFRDDGARIAISDLGGLLLVDASRQDVDIFPQEAGDLAVVTLAANGRVLRIDARHGSTFHDLQTREARYFKRAKPRRGRGWFSGDGSRVIAGNHVHAVPGFAPIAEVPEAARDRRGSVLSGDGKVAASISDLRKAVAWEVDTGKILWFEETDGDPSSNVFEIALSRDGGMLAVMRADGIDFVDLTKGESVSSARTGIGVVEHARGADRMVFTTQAKSTVLWDLKGQALIATVPGVTNTARISTDGRFVVLKDREGTLKILDGRTGEFRRDLDRGRAPSRLLALAVDGGLVVASEMGGKVRVWDAATGAMLRTLYMGDDIRQLTVGADGRTIVMVSLGRVSVHRIERDPPTPHQMLLKLRNLYPDPFFSRNFLLDH